MLKNISLGLGTGTISVAVALVALLVIAGTAFAAGDITVGSATVDNTGDNASVDVTAAAPDGSGIGNWEFEITYDVAELGTPVCTPIKGGCEVNPGGAPGIIRVAGAEGSTAGLTGTVTLVTITADAGVDAGQCSDLTISSVTKFQDQDAEDIADPSKVPGQICVAAAATDAPTDAPTATPASVPQTGGAPGASSANSMAWLLAAAGLTVVAGGAWVLARAGREN